MPNLLGGINLAVQKPAKGMPQKAQLAWDTVFGHDPEHSPEKPLTGAGYIPITYAGDIMVSGGSVRHEYIAEQTVIYSTTVRHIVKVAILEFNNNFKLIPESIEVIY